MMDLSRHQVSVGPGLYSPSTAPTARYLRRPANNCVASARSAATSPPAWYRVEVQTDQPHLLATAFQDAAGRSTLVMINRSTVPLKGAVNWDQAHFTTLERVSQFQPNQVEEFTGKPSSILIEPGSIVTLSDVPLGVLPAGFWSAFNGSQSGWVMHPLYTNFEKNTPL